MRRFVVSTNDVPEAERFAFWREEACQGLVGISAEPRDREAAFAAKAEAWASEFVLFRYRSGGYSPFRERRDIASHSWADYAWFYHERSAGSRLNDAGREIFMSRGDLVIVDPTIPVAAEARIDYDADMVFLARRFLDPYLTVSQRPRGLALTGSSGFVGVVKS